MDGAETTFTIRIHLGGFTDQLFQFSTFYKLGRSLGYEYVHSPFRSLRSSAAVFDYLGFDSLFVEPGRWARIRRSLKTRLARKIDIALNDRILAAAGVASFGALQEYVRRTVRDHAAGRSRVHVRFSWEPGRASRKFFGWVHAAIDDMPDGLDLRSAYEAQRSARPGPSSFPPGHVGVLVHIRQGDTAIVPTPWGTYIPLREPGAIREHSNLDEHLADSVVQPAEFKSFVDRFYRAWKGDPMSVVVSSDGFQRAFQQVLTQADRLGWSPTARAEFQRAGLAYDALQFEPFSRIPNARVIVGESDDNLFELIDAALAADIVIIGHQQKMIPKLLANYSDRSRRTVVILLYKGPHIPDVQRVDLTERKAALIAHRLGDEASLDHVISRVQAELARALRRNDRRQYLAGRHAVEA